MGKGRIEHNKEKVNIIKRVLAGLDGVGVDSVLFMPDTGMLGRGALDGSAFKMESEFIDMPIFMPRRTPHMRRPT